MRAAHLERERLLLVKLDEEDRLLIMRRHELALLIPARLTNQSACRSLHPHKTEAQTTHSLPELKLEMRSAILLRSTHISGVMM